ncbi:hypothetical protein DQT32_03900 [Salmonella enterica subsp. enterica serovar Braenderup]|nr:hypothetical protein [Salmonella enterica subsp. enterica serovar Braenderup]
MFVAILKFRRDSYDYYGDSSREVTITLEAETRKKLNKLIEKATKENVYQNRGDFNLLMSESTLISTKIMKVQDDE